MGICEMDCVICLHYYLNFLEEKNASLALELSNTKHDHSQKLRQLEETCYELQQNLHSVEVMLSNLPGKNFVVPQEPPSASYKSHSPPVAKKFLNEKNLELEYDVIKSKQVTEDTIKKLREAEQLCSKLQKSSLTTLEEKNLELESKAKQATDDSIENLTKVDQNLQSLYENLSLSDLDDGNHTIASLSASPKQPGFTELILDVHYEIISRCIKKDLGFKDGKPVAASIIYMCLLHSHAFESEHTATFEHIIEGINDALKVGDEDTTLPYWLSNVSALICLVQRNLCSNGFLNASSQPSGGSAGLNVKVEQDGLSHKESRHPAISFKHKLSGCLEKIFMFICDNIKNGITPLLDRIIQLIIHRQKREEKRYSTNVMVSGGSYTLLIEPKIRGDLRGKPHRSSVSHWDSVIGLLDSLISRLHLKHVPSFFIHKFITEVFSVINISLFNSILLYRECCTYSNGQYLRSGLVELEKWIQNAKEEFAGGSLNELRHIRHAVKFLMTYHKGKMSLEEMRQDLCLPLTMKQIYQMSTMFSDDKFGAEKVSKGVLSEMREVLNTDAQNQISDALLLFDDPSVPYSVEDMCSATDPSDV